jgi:hypothetical protein
MTVSFVNKIVVQPAHILEKINLGGVSAYHWGYFIKLWKNASIFGYFLLSSLLYFFMAKQEDIFKNVISHAKEYGFIPSSEIYDWAQFMTMPKWSRVKKEHTGILVESHGSNEWKYCGLDASILMHPTWHLDTLML